jgi:hypothetical protein
MQNKAIFTGKWNDGLNTIQINLAMIAFEEDKSNIIYCPALDLSGYGKTENEARESFETTLSEFFSYTIHKKTFPDVLKEMGWSVRKRGKRMTPPTMQKLLENNDNFNRIFNNFPFHKFDQPISMPAA